MDNRVEPRFKTETAASLTVLRHDQVCDYNCLVVDVSGVGYGLMMREPLERGETIRLQVGHDHSQAQVLAVVRHCRLIEDQFSIGVERIDEWLVNPKIAEQRVDESPRIVGRPKVRHLGPLGTIAARQLFEPKSPEKKRRPITIVAPIGAVAAILSLALFFGRVPLRLQAGSKAPAALTNIQDRTPDPATQLNAANEILEAPIAEQHSETQLGVEEKQAASAVPQAVSLDTLPQVATKSSVVLASYVSPSTESKHQVLIKARDLSWVVACADGKKVFEKLVKAGDTDQFDYSTQALVHSGNAGALDIAVDSRSLGAMGEHGVVHAWRFTPEGYKDVPQILNRTCEIR